MTDARIPVRQDLVMREVARERDELRAEVERLRAERQGWADTFAQNMKVIGDENERLKNDRKRLWYALGDATQHHPGECACDYCSVLNGIDPGPRESELQERFETAASENERLSVEVARLRAALEQINRESGQVCPEFETCSHGPCQGSSAAKLIALEALGHHK